MNSNGFSSSAAAAWPSSRCNSAAGFPPWAAGIICMNQVGQPALSLAQVGKLLLLGGRERLGGAGRVVQPPGAKIDFLLEEFQQFQFFGRADAPGAP